MAVTSDLFRNVTFVSACDLEIEVEGRFGIQRPSRKIDTSWGPLPTSLWI